MRMERSSAREIALEIRNLLMDEKEGSSAFLREFISTLCERPVNEKEITSELTKILNIVLVKDLREFRRLVAVSRVRRVPRDVREDGEERRDVLRENLRYCDQT